ncbi:MAG: MFS transporter [Acidiferrobacterales bacterium]
MGTDHDVGASTARNQSGGDTAHSRMILLTLCLAVLMVQVDTSVVNLAVHAIGVALQAPMRMLQWTVDGYTLTYALLLMSGGTLADMFGRRRVFRWGAGLFTLGALASGLAPSAAVLVLGRVVSGIGAALLVPSTLALIRVIWTDPRRRAHAIGIWAGTNGAALAIGPTLGGFLISFAGWRSIFLLIIPLGLLVAWRGRVLPESSDADGRRLDLPGQFLAGVGIAGLTLAVIERGEFAGWSAAFSGVCLVGFLWVERRAGDAAMLPLALLRNRALIAAMGVAAAMTFGMYGVLFLLPWVWLQSGVLSVTWAGIALLPMSLAFVALSHQSGPWSHRFGTRRLMVWGMTLIGTGIGVLSGTHAGRPLWLAEIGLLLTGVGMALNTGPVLAVAVAAVDSSRAGTASALANTARMVGATFGVAVLGAVYDTVGAGASGFSLAMRIGAGVVLGGTLLAGRAIR